MDTCYLFAYGTLRKNFEPGTNLVDARSYRGLGTVAGLLYDLGQYPGAVPHESQRITGDLFEIAESQLALLDEYEGEDYCRKSVMVLLETGETLPAWIYWYNGKTERKPRINQNDYLIYLKTKKNVSYKWNTTP